MAEKAGWGRHVVPILVLVLAVAIPPGLLVQWQLQPDREVTVVVACGSVTASAGGDVWTSDPGVVDAKAATSTTGTLTHVRWRSLKVRVPELQRSIRVHAFSDADAKVGTCS